MALWLHRSRSGGLGCVPENHMIDKSRPSHPSASLATISDLLRAPDRPLIILCAVGVLGSFIAPANSGIGLAAYAGWLLSILLCRKVCKGSIGSLPRLFDAYTAFAVITPAAAIITTLLHGDVTYAAADQVQSYHSGAIRMACVHALFFVAVTASAIATGGNRRQESSSHVARFGERSLNIGAVCTFVLITIRLWLLFGTQIGEIAGYWARIAGNLSLAVAFIPGQGSATNNRASRLAAGASIVLAVFLMISGNRQDGLQLLFILAVGYVSAGTLTVATVKRRLVLGIALGAAASFVTGVIRVDSLGRDGRAGLSRLRNISEIADLFRLHSLTSDETSLDRWISFSTHAVITGVPESVPHEPNGLGNLPFDVVSGFLPKLNYSGKSATDLPRHFLLRDFGFVITWETSSELTTIADGWLRGGWFGVLIVGILTGFALQLTQLIGSTFSTREELKLLVVVFALNAIPMLQGRDLATGLRSMAQAVFAGMIVAGGVALATTRSRRKPYNDRLVPVTR
jgi:hypothetical protein